MITKEMIKKIAPYSKDTLVSNMVPFLNKHMPKYNVNTYLRVVHFLAQAAHESAGFKVLEEYASGAAYEGRKDLGNIIKGDGIRFKGRGMFQLTGRANYTAMSKKLDIDLTGNPELAEGPEVSVLTALEYWNSRGLSAYADKDDVTIITKKINGGYNGLVDRKTYLGKAKLVVPTDIKFMEEVVSVSDGNSMVTEFPSIVVAKIGDKSLYVKDLQEMLIKKGAQIVADGDFGSKSEAAVKTFQQSSGLNITGTIDTNTLNKLMLP